MARGRKDALDTALRHIGLRPRSVHEVKQNLCAKGFEGEDIEKAVGLLLSSGYLDDEKFAGFAAGSRTRLKNWGPMKIAAELRSKGISEDLVNKALAGIRRSEKETTKTALDKWMKKNRLAGRLETQDRAKAFRFLRSRGFSGEACVYALGSGYIIEE